MQIATGANVRFWPIAGCLLLTQSGLFLVLLHFIGLNGDVVLKIFRTREKFLSLGPKKSGTRSYTTSKERNDKENLKIPRSHWFNPW